MIKRQAEIMVRELPQQFPAVLILGPRQCGKTTLARHFLTGEYFDLERPSDQQVFVDDIEFALQRLKTPLIIDEALTLPDLFPVLRSMIDLDRQQTGRYTLLGSVNPALVQHISESLAGRVGIVELTPFLFSEITDLNIDFTDFWLKGGFPDALKEKEGSKWQRWQENYLRTFIERDIPRYAVKISNTNQTFDGHACSPAWRTVQCFRSRPIVGGFLPYNSQLSGSHGRTFFGSAVAPLFSEHKKKNCEICQNIHPRLWGVALPSWNFQCKIPAGIAQKGKQLGGVYNRTDH